MKNVLRANPQDVLEQYERQRKELQEAYGEATEKKLQFLQGGDEK